MSKALVRNASSKKQVKDAVRKEKFNRESELEDIKEVLKSVNGRRFIWRILSKCKTFESIWQPSAMIHYNSGMQDLGHFIMAEITDADAELLFLMMKENKKEEN